MGAVAMGTAWSSQWERNRTQAVTLHNLNGAARNL